ncbi:MAG: hypothetical protein M3Y58_23625 [Chloroflexota bacterium]|nr:hypothetical protein [Chloroflexota bacterium]
MSHKLRFLPNDGFDDSERARLIAFIGAHPFDAVAEGLWRCRLPDLTTYGVEARRGYLVVQHLDWRGIPTTLARIASAHHEQEAWCRAVQTVANHAEGRQAA